MLLSPRVLSGELEACSLMLVSKGIPRMVELRPTLGSSESGVDFASASHKPREQVYLENTKPSKFNGDDENNIIFYVSVFSSQFSNQSNQIMVFMECKCESSRKEEF